MRIMCLITSFYKAAVAILVAPVAGMGTPYLPEGPLFHHQHCEGECLKYDFYHSHPSEFFLYTCMRPSAAVSTFSFRNIKAHAFSNAPESSCMAVKMRCRIIE